MDRTAISPRGLAEKAAVISAESGPASGRAALRAAPVSALI